MKLIDIAEEVTARIGNIDSVHTYTQTVRKLYDSHWMHQKAIRDADDDEIVHKRYGDCNSIMPYAGEATDKCIYLSQLK